jgi:KDO2-lipid IV(A) lauroyltransferase
MRSWFRNLANSVRLGRYSQSQILRLVQVDEASAKLVRDAWETTGAVIALPHMGDWDLSGAWACAEGMPVSSVAERLPDEEFAYFMRARRRVGMTVYSHKDAEVMDKLAADLASSHLVALVADRDLSRHSIPVVWQTASGPQHVTMPPGPAVLARRTGAQLLVARSLYRRGGISLRFMGPIEVDMGEDGVAITTQRLADVFASLVAEKPVDWHLMQRFFPGLKAE